MHQIIWFYIIQNVLDHSLLSNLYYFCRYAGIIYNSLGTYLVNLLL